MSEVERIHRTSAQTPPPKFLMVGMEVPAGVRLYASRHMPSGLKFGQVEAGFETHWHVEGALSNMLIITKPTWNEALAELFRIWSNQDANERGLPGQAASPSPWKPIGGGMAIAPAGTPEPPARALSMPIDQPMAIGFGPEGVAPRTSPPATEWPWPHDVHECTDECPPEVRQAPKQLRCKRQRAGCLGEVTAADWKPFYQDYVCSNCVALDAADVRRGINPPGDNGVGKLFGKLAPEPSRYAQICPGCGARYGSQEETSLIPEHERTTGVIDGSLVRERCEGSGQPPHHSAEILLPDGVKESAR